MGEPRSTRGWRRFGPHTLAGSFLGWQLAVVALVLAVAGVVSVRQAVSQFSASAGDRILGAAENLANNPLLRELPDLVAPTATVAPLVESVRVQSGATLVLVADPARRLVAATDPTLVGATLVLPDEAAWTGRAWDGDLDLGGELIAATVPVYAVDGTVVGLALVAERYPSTWSVLVAGVPELLLLIALAAVAGGTGSWVLSRRIKRQTHGLEPAEIATLADHREALLHSIREGVLGVGADGRVTVLNDAARDLLQLPDDAVGRPVTEIGLDPALLAVVVGRRRGTDLVVVHGDRVLVANRRAIRRTPRAPGTGGAVGRSDAALGTVTTLRDRSELLAVQRQLGATRSATNTLRAQTHEFDNQLHVISGLAEFGRLDEVREYVGALTRRRAEAGTSLSAHIADPAVGALLTAKTTLAAESGVTLEISSESDCAGLDVELSTDVAAVLGNLVDNALDAVAGSSPARVTVEVVADERAVRLRVSDTGPGIAPELADRLFERGWTTKTDGGAGGRGIGLSLVRRICEDRGGSVQVTSDGGATFTAELPRVPAFAGTEPAG